MEAADAASLAVHTQDLAKRYGKTVALSGLTMSVRRAEVFGVLGPNGAGKTTGGTLHGGSGMGARRANRRPADAATARLSPRALPLPGLDEGARGAWPSLRAFRDG